MIKLVIWDLNDTLSQGTLAEGDEVPVPGIVSIPQWLNGKQ